MDRLKQLQHLAEAERNIAGGEHPIFEQELRIADLDCRGLDTTLARSLLKTFRITSPTHCGPRSRSWSTGPVSSPRLARRSRPGTTIDLCKYA